MRDSIRLHPKNGLNATMPVCFWCGKEKGEIAMLGAAFKGDEPAPMRMVLDYNPCDQCASDMGRGIVCIEIVAASLTKNPPLAKDGALGSMAPTGRWVVVTVDAIERLFPDKAASIVEAGRVVMEHEVFTALFNEAADEANAEG